MKRRFLLVLVFFQIGCFPMTRSMLRVQDRKEIAVESAAFVHDESALVIRLKKSTSLSNCQLPNPIRLPVSDFQSGKESQTKFRLMEVFRNQKPPDEASEREPIDDRVRLTGNGYRYSRNPILWCFAPVTLAGDVVFGVFTLGIGNLFAAGYQKKRENFTSSLVVRVSPE